MAVALGAWPGLVPPGVLVGRFRGWMRLVLPSGFVMGGVRLARSGVVVRQ